MRLSILAAVAANGVIGRAGDLPWHLRRDLRRFRDLTMGHTVIAGRKTHEAIVRRLGGPLPGRRTIVLSRNPAYAAVGSEVAHSWEQAITLAAGAADVFVIGGSEVYALGLPHADRLLLTRVHAEVSGDAFFPPFDAGAWRVESRESYPADADNEYPHTFEVLVRTGG